MSRETHIPAKSTEACPYPRVPQPHVNKERTQGSGKPPGQGSQTSGNKLKPVNLRRLQKRAEFLRAAKGDTVRRKLVVVQTCNRQDGLSTIGEGFTSTRKIGGAVVRNRARRRMRVASRELLPKHGRPGHDYVFIARAETALAPWESLLDDVETALIRLHSNKSGTRDRAAHRQR